MRRMAEINSQKEIEKPGKNPQGNSLLTSYLIYNETSKAAVK